MIAYSTRPLTHNVSFSWDVLQEDSLKRQREEDLKLKPSLGYFIIPNIFSMKNVNPKLPSKNHKGPPCTPAVLSYFYPALISCSSHASTILQRKCLCSCPEGTADTLLCPWLRQHFSPSKLGLLISALSAPCPFGSLSLIPHGEKQRAGIPQIRCDHCNDSWLIHPFFLPPTQEKFVRYHKCE